LFAYLLLQGERSHPREVLADLFWGEQPQERARSCLSTALWRLRNALEPEGVRRGTYLLVTPAGEVSFNWQSEHWIDVELFVQQSNVILARSTEATGPEDIKQLESALQLYTGELLEGVYDDWALIERERMRSRYLNILVRLLGHYKQHGCYEDALHCGEKVLEHDGLREDIHREMIQLYLTTGQRAMALRQYELCRTLLASELGVAPLPETEALRAQIAPASRLAAAPAGVLNSASLHQALEQVNRAMCSFEEAKRELQKAIQSVEQLTDS
jgi:DNA-binding SARP family transcriptional activator